MFSILPAPNDTMMQTTNIVNVWRQRAILSNSCNSVTAVTAFTTAEETEISQPGPYVVSLYH